MNRRTATKVCDRCGRVGRASFRRWDRLPDGTVIWHCAERRACLQRRRRLAARRSPGAPSPSPLGLLSH